MLGPAHRRAVELACERLADSGLRWAVGGSVALALQGIDVRCRDLDLLADAGAAGELLRQLDEPPSEAVAARTRGRIRAEFGRTRLAGVEVEVLGGVRNLLADGTWTAPPDLHADATMVALGAGRCPVLGLARMREAYAAMGRWQTVRLIDAARQAPPLHGASGPPAHMLGRCAAATPTPRGRKS